LRSIIKLLKQYGLSILLLAFTLFILHYFTGTVCLSIIVFGIPCPACGITRASFLLLTGHFYESFHMHPLLFLVITGIILYPLLKSSTQRYKFFMNLYVIITIVAFLCLYFYRMLKYFPYEEPMVYYKDNLFAKVYTLIQHMKQLL
jgi:hypothetical protein